MINPTLFKKAVRVADDESPNVHLHKLIWSYLSAQNSDFGSNSEAKPAYEESLITRNHQVGPGAYSDS